MTNSKDDPIVPKDGPIVPKDALIGPRVSIALRCGDCRFSVAEYYCIEDGNDVDSGFNYYCTQSLVRGELARVRTDNRPPRSCPFRETAIAQAVAKEI